RDLQAEPCLARAAGAGECQQAGSAQQLPTLTHLVVTADETRHLRGQVVRCGFQGAQCRKFARRPVDVELVKPFRTGELVAPVQSSSALPNTMKNESPSVRSSLPPCSASAWRSTV